MSTLYQISTSSALVEGVYSGSVCSSVLLEHGDFGLGTFEGLDGEMVILDSQIYQVADRVRHRTDDFLVPFTSRTSKARSSASGPRATRVPSASPDIIFTLFPKTEQKVATSWIAPRRNSKLGSRFFRSTTFGFRTADLS